MPRIARFHKLIRTDFARSSIYSAAATIVRMAAGFVLGKIIATHLGPDGLGLFGQLSNFVVIALVLAGGSLTNGVVKYIAEYRSKAPENLPGLLSTALRIILASGVILGAIMIWFSKSLSLLILLDAGHWMVFVIFGFTIAFYGLNTLMVSILNGYKDFVKFNAVSAAGSIIGLAITFVCVYFWQVQGALISLVVNQSVIFVFTLYFMRKEPWLRRDNFNRKISKVHASRLSTFMLMAAISTACLPLVQMFLRGYIIRSSSLLSAGIWEAMNRISGYYLLFVTASLTTYYLPRLSEIASTRELREEILKVYKWVMPLVILVSITIYLFRHFIISLLFSSQFGPTETLFKFQLIGDIFKVAAWLLSFQMVAKAMVRKYIVTEIAFALSFAGLSLIGFNKYGLQGLTIAYAINYFLYFCCMLFLFRKMLFF
jgi:O-antigen/teichoic acid export membrane protein